MFEGVVTAVLNKFLGDYVANMEQKQLNVGIFSGNVVLTDLKLKKEALDKLNLPIEVFHGHLGRLELHIPWTSLKTQPVSVVVEDLFLLAGPRIEAGYDPELEEEREQKTKQERLETAELFASSAENKLSDDIHHESFVNQLVTKIVDNLQVTVKNVHIRFEDRTSNKERMFSVGITLKNLSAVSTDENWQETFIVNPQDAVNKLVKLDMLSVYWNTRDEAMQGLSFDDFIDSCRRRIDDSTHAYIIKPVSGVGKATLNKKFKDGIPKTLVNVFFDAFGININYEQYYDILCVLASVSAAQRAIPYRKFYPTTENPSSSEMWQFAIKSFLSKIHEKNRKRTWSFIMERRVDRKNYINLYSNRIIVGQLNEAESRFLVELERKFEFDDIIQYRNLAKAFAKRSLASSPKATRSWFWGWLGYKNAVTSELVRDEDIQELYETIEYDASQETSVDSIPPKANMLQVNFKLGEGSFSISEAPDSAKYMVSLIFTQLAATFVKRPKTIAADLSLNDLKVIENLLEESNFKELLQVKPLKVSSPKPKESFLAILYDQMAKNPDASAEIIIHMKPLILVVNMLVVDKLTRFFLNTKTKVLLEAVKAEARRTFDTFQVQTRANLQRALKEHKGTDLKVKVNAPIILFPEDPADLSKSVFVVDLGKLSAVSELVSIEEKEKIQSKKRQLTEEETEAFHDLLYDKIRVELRQIGVYFYENAGVWLDSIEDNFDDYPCKENKIIDEIDLKLIIENSIIPAANIAHTKLSATLPEIVMFLSDHKFKKIMTLMDQLPKSSPIEEKISNDNKLEKPKLRRTPPLKSTGRPEGVSEDEFYDAFDDMKIVEGGKPIRDIEEVMDPLIFIGNFVIEKIFIFMSEKTESEEKLIMSILADKMFLGLTLFETLTTLDFRLGGIGVREHFSSHDGFLLIDAQAEASSDDLLNVLVKLVKPRNAEFSTTFKEIERSVSIGLSSIKISLDPLNVSKVVKFAFENILPTLETEASGPETEIKLVSTSLIETYQPKTVIDFVFSGLNISLLENESLIGWLEADQFVMNISMAGKKLELGGEMISMKINGFNNSNRVELIYFEGGSVANFKFENNCKASETIIEGSNLACINSGSLRIAYDAEAYAGIVKTGYKFLKITELMRTGKAPAGPMHVGTSMPMVIATYLRLTLDSPIVFIPSEDHQKILAFYLGTLKVFNTIEVVPNGGLDQVFDINLSDIHISLQAEENRVLLREFSIPLRLRVTNNAMKRNYADIEIDGDIEVIRAELDEFSYGAMMKVIQDTTRSISVILDSLPKSAEEPNVASVSTKVTDEDRFPFDAKIQLKQLCLLLKDPNDKDMVIMSIEGINFTAVSHTKRGLGVEACVESLRISDVSDPKLYFKDLAAIGTAAAGLNKPLVDSRKQILFRMEQKPDQTLKINVYLESPRIFVLFEPIFYMRKFFLANLPRGRVPTEVRSKTPPEAVKPGQVIMVFNMLDANLIILDDCAKNDTDALSLRIGSLAVRMSKDLMIDVDDVSSFIYNVNSPEETRITMIDYFASHIKLSTELEEKKSEMNIAVHPLTITLSYRDLQLILSFLDTMNKAQSLYQFNMVVIDDKSEVSVEMTSPIKTHLTEKGTISLEYVRVMVIDDSSSAIVPLLELNVNTISMELSDWSSQLKLDLSATLASNCYNPAVSYWEPIIEPWNFSLTIGKSEFEPNSDTTILLSSQKGLEILIVHQSLERILSMLYKLGVEKRSASASREISSPYVFGNFLEMPVRIIGNKDESKSIRLKSQDTGKFAFEDWRQQRTSLFSTAHKIAIDFLGEFNNIEGFSIDQDGYFPLKLVKEDLNVNPREFYLQTFLVDGIRHVNLREKIIVHNDTKCTLVITLEGNDIGKSIQIESGNKACIPPWFENSPCTITPIVEDLKLAPVSSVFIPNYMINIDGKVLRADSMSDDRASFNILVSCHQPRLANYIVDISFVAPVWVENLLPINIQVQFTQGAYRKVSDVIEGELVPFYYVDPSRPCTVAVSIPDLGLFSTNECNSEYGNDISDLTMQNEDGLELKLSLNRTMLPSCAMKLSIAAYYLLVNQTNMTVQVLSEANNKIKRNGQVFSLPSAEDGKPLLIFSHPNTKSLKNRARIRVADSNWSEPMSFEAVGSEFDFDCKSMLTSKWYNLGGYIKLGKGKFGVTKIIFIASRYYVVNDTEEDLIISDSQIQITVSAKSQVPMHIDPSNIECISIKSTLETKDDNWSSPFDIKNTGKVYNVDVSRTCESKTQTNYSWDQPSFNEKELILKIENKEYVLDVLEVGKKTRFKVKSCAGEPMWLDLEVKAQGPAILILLKDRYTCESLNEGAVVQNNSEYVEIFQTVLLAKLPYIAISLIGQDLKEIMLVYIREIDARYAISKQFISYGLIIKWLQIDNQAFDWDLPMLLYPAILSKSKKELEEHPFLSFGAIQSRDQSYGVTYYKYLGLLIQEVALEMSEELLRNILNFVNLSVLIAESKTYENSIRIINGKECVVARYEVERDSSEVLFFEFFQIHPIKVSLTFSRTEDSSNQGDSSKTYNPLTTVIDVLTMTFGNISEAPLKFNALVLENILSRQTTLQEIVVEHYKVEALSQIHLVLGSADFLGNPVGLVSTLGSGVTDLFYEPYQGFVSDRPQDIGIGFARGGISLVKKTVSGLSGTLSKFTGSLAKGLSAATLDKSYQQKRRVDRAKNKPKHALSGVSTGVRQLYSGFKSGLAGVVDKPLEGAKEGGVGGFFRGVGVGIVGVVTKPMVGIIDMTTSLTEGIKGSADDNQNTVTQVRFPRVVPFDRKIHHYELREAFGQSILIGVVGFKEVGQEFYVAHVEVPGEDSIVILTNNRLMYTSVTRLKIVWEVKLNIVREINMTIDSILVVMEIERENRTKVIPIVDKETMEWFIGVVKNQITFLQ